MRYADEVRRFAEFQSQVLAHVMATHLGQKMKAVAANEHSPGAQGMAVCFVDLVGFTALGEQLDAVELGRLVGRLDTLTTGVVEPPARFVKMVGDAVMLISPDPIILCRTVLSIMAAARAEGLPHLHAGIAWGTAVPSAGDWIGHPVNLASRLVAVAKPTETIIDDEVRRRLDPQAIPTDPVGHFPLKGFSNSHQLFRLRTELHSDTA